jgi:hypothetical protein
MANIDDLVLTHAASILRTRDDSPPITLMSTLQDELAFSSLNLIILLTGLCDALGIDVGELSEVAMVRMRTLGDVRDALKACSVS